jgi:transposase
LLRVARKTAAKARTQALNSMRAFIVTAPDDLREQLRGLTKDTLPDKCASLRPKGSEPTAAAKIALRSLARRMHALGAEIQALDTEWLRSSSAPLPNCAAAWAWEPMSQPLFWPRPGTTPTA